MSALTIDGDLYWQTPNGTIYLSNGGKDANCTISVCPVELSVYGYRPSLPFSSVLLALYGLNIGIQLILGWRYRSWGYMSVVILGCVDEIIGYVGRILLYANPWASAGFIIQIVLITIGPVFFSAAIYVMLYQIALYISPLASRFPINLFYWVFIPCDIISLILQATGGAMSSTSNGKSTSGVDIALAGLAFQVVTLVVFSVLCVDYMFRSRYVWRSEGVKLSWRFKNFCFWLALATTLILTRCCYRVYELNEGYSRYSKALRDEPLFNGLEGVMIIASAFCLVLAHPGFVFNKKGERTPAQMVADGHILFGGQKVVADGSHDGNMEELRSLNDRT